MKKWQQATQSIHTGERNKLIDSPVFPIWQTATYIFQNYREIKDFNTGRSHKDKYGRYGNPTQTALEEKLAALESAEEALVFASGMTAITTTILSLVSNGDHIIYCEGLYRNSTKFFAEILPRFGIKTTEIKVAGYHTLGDAIRENTKIVFFEIPTNILLRVADIAKIRAAIAKTNRPLLVVDSSFASPYNIQPLKLGADLVIHSLTKYLAGHDDLLGGAVCGNHFLIDKICAYRDILGGISDPHNVYLILRSLKTFVVRMEQLNKNGYRIAQFLDKHPKVIKVLYPGLVSHPDYKIARKYLKGFGSVIYFEMLGGKRATQKFIENLKIAYIGTNFGGVHTLIEPVSILTYAKLSSAERKKIGVGENLVRLCVGLEDSGDLIYDLQKSLEMV